MKSTYKISHLAEQDIESIWKYTFENWSIDQADKYYNLIIEEIERICDQPEIGRSIENIKQKHRIRRMLSHMIVYKIEKEVVWIDRVLHKRMDIKGSLDE